MEKYNIILSSKNKPSYQSISTFTINFEKPYIAAEDEYFSLNMIHFNTVKAFDAVKTGLNSDCDLILRQDGEYDSYFDFHIPEGSYDVLILTYC